MEKCKEQEAKWNQYFCVSFGEGKLNCPKKCTGDEIPQQNAVLLFRAYKRTGTETLLSNINNSMFKVQKGSFKINHLTLQFCLLNKNKIEDIHVHRCVCLVHTTQMCFLNAAASQFPYNFILLIYILNVWMAYFHVCLCSMCMPGTHRGRKKHWIAWNYNGYCKSNPGTLEKQLVLLKP